MSSTCSRLFRTGCSNVVLVRTMLLMLVRTMLLAVDELTRPEHVVGSAQINLISMMFYVVNNCEQCCFNMMTSMFNAVLTI